MFYSDIMNFAALNFKTHCEVGFSYQPSSTLVATTTSDCYSSDRALYAYLVLFGVFCFGVYLVFHKIVYSHGS